MASTIVQPSDFIGEIQIANKTQADVSVNLAYFISKYEPIFLKQLFGYSFYSLFESAILTATALPQSLDLSFINSSGFTIDWQNGVPSGQPKTYAQLFGNSPEPNILFDHGGGNFTPDGSYTIQKDGNGTVISIVFDFGSVQNGYIQFTAIVPLSTLPADYVYTPSNRFTDLITPEFRRMVASFIYYYYQRDQVTQTVGVGNVQTKSANAVVTSGGKKLSRAWNEMVGLVYSTLRILTDAPDTYPEYVVPNWLIWRMCDQYWWEQDYYLYPNGFGKIPDIFNSINDMNI